LIIDKGFTGQILPQSAQSFFLEFVLARLKARKALRTFLENQLKINFALFAKNLCALCG